MLLNMLQFLGVNAALATAISIDGKALNSARRAHQTTSVTRKIERLLVGRLCGTATLVNSNIEFPFSLTVSDRNDTVPIRTRLPLVVGAWITSDADISLKRKRKSAAAL